MNDIENRARFEAWAKTTYTINRGIDGQYLNVHTEDAWHAWQAALTPPEGYVLVPVAPTEGMEKAAFAAAGYLTLTNWGGLREIWGAALAEIPEVP